MKLMANIVFFNISLECCVNQSVEGSPSSTPRSFGPIAGRHAPRARSVGSYERYTRVQASSVCFPKRSDYRAQGNIYPSQGKYFPSGSLGPGRLKKPHLPATPRAPAAAPVSAPGSPPGPGLAARASGAFPQRF